MSKTILYIASSLDGYIAGKNDDLSWLDPYQTVDYAFDAFFSTIGSIIEGRRTYDIEIRNGWEPPHPVPLFVLTRSAPQKKPARPEVVFTHDDIAVVLAAAQEKSGPKDVWIEGGAEVAQQFLDRSLIDLIMLTLVPVFLGQGIRLFENTQPLSLTLLDVKRFDRGLVQLVYETSKQNRGQLS
jgi:dihydrofolate reductase